MAKLTEGQIYKFGEEATIYAQTPEGVLKGFRTEEELARYGKTWQEANPLSIEEKSQYTIGDPFYDEPISGITSDTLKPQTPIDLSGVPKDVVDEAGLAVANIDEQRKLDIEAAEKAAKEAAEKQATKVEDITGLLTQLEEEPAERIAAEEEAGIPAFKQQQADIQGQIGIKTAEYRQLETQEEAIMTQLEGQPLSTGYIIGQKAQAAREFRSRKNMIASDLSLLQAQSLAITGKQSAAQSAVDRAIDLKYDTVAQKIKTQKFLLDIISFNLTKAEEKQADLRNAELDRQEAELEERKDKEKAEKNVLLTQMKNYPDAGITLDDTIESANAKVASQSRIYFEQIRPPVSAGVGTAGLTKDQISQMFKIQTNIRQDPDVKGFIDIRDSYNRVKAAATDPSAAGDLALIFNYMKILDPASVVRESEFATAAAAGGWGDRLAAAGERIKKGKLLSDDMRADFVDRAGRLFQPKLETYQSAIDFYGMQATSMGIPNDLVLRDFTTPEAPIAPEPEPADVLGWYSAGVEPSQAESDYIDSLGEPEKPSFWQRLKSFSPMELFKKRNDPLNIR